MVKELLNDRIVFIESQDAYQNQIIAKRFILFENLDSMKSRWVIDKSLGKGKFLRKSKIQEQRLSLDQKPRFREKAKFDSKSWNLGKTELRGKA